MHWKKPMIGKTTEAFFFSTGLVQERWGIRNGQREGESNSRIRMRRRSFDWLCDWMHFVAKYHIAKRYFSSTALKGPRSASNERMNGRKRGLKMTGRTTLEVQGRREGRCLSSREALWIEHMCWSAIGFVVVVVVCYKSKEKINNWSSCCNSLEIRISSTGDNLWTRNRSLLSRRLSMAGICTCSGLLVLIEWNRERQ